MQPVAFQSPVPLHLPSSCRERHKLSDPPSNPICVAKPPPRTPQSNRVSKSGNKKKQNQKKQTAISDSVSRPTEELTAAQLSDKLARAFGFDLILEDVTRLTNFFRSFVKPKSSNQVELPSDDDSDSDLQSETSLIIPTQSFTYKPKSATARKIATSYTAARGAIDRALQSLSIHAKSYVNTVAHVTGDTLYKILSAGHEAFPTLGFDRAKDAVTGVLKDGWTPLSVFQWQLSAAPTENIEQRRQARILQISKFFRGGAVDFVNATGSALTGVGKAAEKLAPIMAKGVGKATSGYVEKVYSRKLPKPVLGSESVIRKSQKQKTRRNRAKYNQYVPKRSSKLSNHRDTSPETDVAPKSLGTVQLPFPEVALPINTEEDSSSVPSLSPTTREVHVIERESEHGTEHRINTSSTTSSQSKDESDKEDDSEGVQKGNAQLLRNGAIVLAAGAVATAAASVSVPTAITCSTLMVASMALSGAKIAKASDLQIQERHRVRQSRSVQNLEGVFGKAPKAVYVKPRRPKALLAPAINNTQSHRAVTISATNPLEATAKTVKAGASVTEAVDAPAYTVSESKPTIMTIPIVGFLLNWLDVMAYHTEGLVGTVLRRSGVWYPTNKETAEWELLRSFRRNSRPD